MKRSVFFLAGIAGACSLGSLILLHKPSIGSVSDFSPNNAVASTFRGTGGLMSSISKIIINHVR